MEDKQSRVRWSNDELGRLAAFMAPRLLADPGLHLLEAVRVAQDCLEPTRRRELKAWSLVESRLQPRLDEALARLRAVPPQSIADEADKWAGEPMVPAHDLLGTTNDRTPDIASAPPIAIPKIGSAEAAVPGLSAELEQGNRVHNGQATGAQPDAVHLERNTGLFDAQAAPQTSASTGAVTGDAEDGDAQGTMASASGAIRAPATTASPTSRHDESVRPAAVVTQDASWIETALLTALQSPAVEEALVELFARTMSKAFVQASPGESRPVSTASVKPSAAQRVLLAGFAEAQQKALTEALGEHFDVRSWKPSNGPQLFETLAKLCKTVIFPEDADDEADAGLKDMGVRVIRHVGNASRLVERIEALE